jgi:predicted methyltransferase
MAMARRTLRWLAISSMALCTACTGETAATRRVAAPVAGPAPSESPPGSSVPSTRPQSSSPPAVASDSRPAPAPSTPAIAPSAPQANAPDTLPAAPEGAAPTVQPAAAPVAALPPCPTEPRRDRDRRPDDVVQLAQLSDAMTVVDLGSGDGYFLCRLSRAVGEHGHVIATEITQALVRDLKKRIAREQLSNVEAILAPTNDVGITAGRADRVVIVHVWHHLTDRARYAARIARALAPGGKVVVVDFKPDRGSGHGIAPERILAELTAAGLDASLVPEDLPDDYVIVGSVHQH